MFVKPWPNDSNISRQHIPTLLSRHCKLRPNDRNIWTQQIATLLGETCCTRLATKLQRVAICCELKIELVRMPRRNIVVRTWTNNYNTMQHPQMLHEKFDHFQIWANKPNMLQHVATGWPNAAGSFIYIYLCVFNTAYIGLFDRSLLHMSLNQVELVFKNATSKSRRHLCMYQFDL